MASSRPLASVHVAAGESASQTALPAVFTAPIRPDIVRAVHTGLAKNHRQPYAVKFEAGMQTSAESWGTGRAVSRIPRVPGGGTHRAGQGAFGNMCRGGRMFAPTKVWRRWHRKVNLNQKRYAVASALAASALPSLVLARGHRIEQVTEVPLVFDDADASILKTSAAVALLKKVGAYADVEKAKASRNIRRGKGKMRNRRYVGRKGPLVVFGDEDKIGKAFRNLPGVEVSSVDSLNLLQLAPGGHVGRFIVWTKSAFEKLDSVFGTTTEVSASKKGYKLPRSLLTNSDLTRLINSDEIQSIVKEPKTRTRTHMPLKKNPLKNLGALLKLNPYAKTERRQQLALEGQRRKAKGEKLDKIRKGEKGAADTHRSADLKAASKDFYKQMITDSHYVGDDYDVFGKWLGADADAEEAE
jgi:large subunit ribosomal protein L4e